MSFSTPLASSACIHAIYVCSYGPGEDEGASGGITNENKPRILLMGLRRSVSTPNVSSHGNYHILVCLQGWKVLHSEGGVPQALAK